jgi:hypothetical protein
MNMKHDKRKGFLAGYRKAGPTLKFVIWLAIIAVILAICFFVVQFCTSKSDFHDAAENREENFTSISKRFDNIDKKLTKREDLIKYRTPIKSPAYLKSDKELNEIFNTGTVFMWFKINSSNDKKDRYLFDFVNYYDKSAFRLYIVNNVTLMFDIFDNHNRKYSLSYTSSKAFTKFTAVHVTWASKNEIKLYLNGNSVSTQQVVDAVFSGPVRDFYIGTDLNGIIGEIRLSNIVRSEGWIKATYHNLSDPGSFVYPGTPERP